MVQAIENWASVTGAVLQVTPSARGPQWRVVVLEVDPAQVLDIGGWPNLVRGQVSDDHRLAVTCRAASIDESTVSPGREVTGRARLVAPGQVMAHPDGFGAV